MKYTHTHHVIPKHMGGTDSPDNLVELTPQEHADAHNLLWCLHKNKFDKIAEQALLGQITFDEAQHQAIVEGARRGQKIRELRGDDFGEKIRGVPRPPFSNEWKANMKAAALNRKKMACKHCGIVTIPQNIARWHNDNCKHREV